MKTIYRKSSERQAEVRDIDQCWKGSVCVVARPVTRVMVNYAFPGRLLSTRQTTVESVK